MLKSLPVKIVALSVLLVLTLGNARGDDPAWAWLHGPADTSCAQGIYGTQGFAAKGNRPGTRSWAAAWTDKAGNLWLFGGEGYDSRNQEGDLNDLWKYDAATGCWTWVKGSNQHSQAGVYGTKGMSAPGNTPGARIAPATWTDADGRLWLFGGMGVNENNAAMAALSDFWRFDPATNEWTWMSGSTQFEQYGVYGTQGVGAPDNTPGARVEASSWTDHAGRFWLFGGSGRGRQYTSSGKLNDLWCYDPGTGYWTWVKGNDIAGKLGFYGTKGVEAPTYSPDPRSGAATWTDAQGLLWLYGGIADDLWRFNPATGNWAWMAGDNNKKKTPIYGAQGVPDPANNPGGRMLPVCWTDKSGMLWLFGGAGLDESGTSSYMNDLWRLDPATLQWTWMKGDKVGNQAGFYPILGAADPASAPAARVYASAWTAPDGRFWLFGGRGPSFADSSNSRLFNDLWSFEPTTNNWTWVGGGINEYAQMPVYETKSLVTTCTTPGTRYDAASWTDAQGRYWLFGGVNQYPRNDLWRLDPATGLWQWVKGGKGENQPGVYGVRGTAAPGNMPGARSGAQTWADQKGRLWLYGGLGYGDTASTVTGVLADLWRYDPDANEWTWIQGSSAPKQAPSYGVLGVADPANTPGARKNAVTWIDQSGRLWLFGGADAVKAPRNDLWRYDPDAGCWTWVKGSNLASQPGRLDMLRPDSPTNAPGAREGAVSWTDKAGGFWLYSGDGVTDFGDMWKFDPATNIWTWISGKATTGDVYPLINYGVQGIESPQNKPGARRNCIAWTDPKGIFWFFGGYGIQAHGQLNDLWSFDPLTGNWTWRAGSASAYPPPVYGPAGTASTAYCPAGRSDAVAWCGKDGQAWIYSGMEKSGGLADLWRLSPVTLLPAPVILTHPAPQTVNPGAMAVFSVTTSGTQPLTFQWRRNGAVLTNGGRISGATSSTLSIKVATWLDDAGFYSCDVVNAKGGVVTSNKARLVVNPTIKVYSTYGTPTPVIGETAFTTGTVVTVRMDGSPVVDAAGTTRWVCTGWRALIGSAPSQGSTTSFTVKLTEPTIIDWQWSKQYKLGVTASPAAAGKATLADGVTAAQGWHDADQTLTLKAVANAGYLFVRWTGDQPGRTNPISVLMNRPMTLGVQFRDRNTAVHQWEEYR